MSDKRYVTFQEQRLNVIQLLKDRKNRYGGLEEGMKDFAEKGPHQGGRWPLSAESIKLKFGKPPRGKDQSDAEYVESIKAASADMIDFALHHYLRHVSSEAYRCVLDVFSADMAADSDFDELLKRARADVSVAQEKWDKMTYEQRRSVIDRKKRQLAHEEKYLQCEAGIILITHLLWHNDLFVEYARQRTKAEEESNAQKGRRIYVEFKSLVAAQPEGRGLTSKAAYEVLHKDWGISISRLEQIVALQRQTVDKLAARRPGRPKKAAS